MKPKFPKLVNQDTTKPAVTAKDFDPAAVKKAMWWTVTRVEVSKQEAKISAFKALAACNYVSFASWARVWSQLNGISWDPEPSPFTPLANMAKDTLEKLQPQKKK